MVEEGDCELLWEWANDPQVRESSFSPDPIPWEDHVAWFRRKRADPRCHMYIVTDEGGRPVGQVRFDLRADHNAEVDISIAEAERGRGYAVAALRLGCERVREAGGRTIVAYIKEENTASLRAFSGAGFAFEGLGREKRHPAVRMTLPADEA